MATQQQQVFETTTQGGGRSVLHKDLRAAGIDADALWQPGEPFPGAKGRGGVSVLRPAPGFVLVARDFRRGGALGGLMAQSYFNSKRATEELELLQTLAERNVPVVEPMAALARRRGLFWRLRLVTRLWEGSQPLPSFVRQHPEKRNAAIAQAGAAVQAAFAAGLLHHDLHPDNLLANGDEPQIRLLDLDRCRLTPKLYEDEQDRMLLRMARYLVKHRERVGPYGPRDYLRFLRGMSIPREQAAERMQRLGPQFVEELGRHGLKK